MRVSEFQKVWRYDGTTFRIDRLEGDEYVSTDSSVAFPILTVQSASDFLEESRRSTRLGWLKSLREWIGQHRDSG